MKIKSKLSLLAGVLALGQASLFADKEVVKKADPAAVKATEEVAAADAAKAKVAATEKAPEAEQAKKEVQKAVK